MFAFLMKIIVFLILGGIIGAIAFFILNQKTGRTGIVSNIAESLVHMVGCFIFAILGIIVLFIFGKIFGAYTFAIFIGSIFGFSIISMTEEDKL